MADVIKGDLSVLRSIQAGRRANQTAFGQALIGTLTLDKDAYAWYNLTAAAPQDVVLPSATTLVAGWSIVINNIDTTNAITVKDASSGTVKAVIAGRAYRFTAIDVSDAAGDWHIDFLEEADLLPAERYTTGFNATTDWGSPVGGYYTWTLLQSTHLMGTNPNFIIEEVDGSDFNEVRCDQAKVLANGDIALRVTQTPDGRFAGRITVL